MKKFKNLTCRLYRISP